MPSAEGNRLYESYEYRLRWGDCKGAHCPLGDRLNWWLKSLAPTGKLIMLAHVEEYALLGIR